MKGQVFCFQQNSGTLTQGVDVHFYTFVDPVAGLLRPSLFLQAKGAFLSHTLERMVGPACLVCPADKFLQFQDLLFLLHNGLFPQTLFLCILLFVGIIAAVIDGNFVCGFVNKQDFIDNLV